MKIKPFFSFSMLYGLSLFLSPVSQASLQSEVLQDRGNAEQRLVSSSQNRLSQEVWEECRTQLLHFGLLPEEAEAWQEHLKVADRKESIIISNATFLALGVWQVDQDTKRQMQAGQTPLSPDIMISCILRTKLSLSRMPWDQITRVIPLIKVNPYLTQLDLFKCGIIDQDINSLMSLLHLKDLSLEENHITDQGATKLSTHSNIVSLKLWKNNIRPEGVRGFAQNRILKELGLYKNHIGDKGAQYLAQSTTLTHLDLRENNISDTGAKALALNRSITSLRLRYNKITDKGAEYFLSNSHIADLDLRRNQISDPELVNFLEGPSTNDSIGYLQNISF